MTVARVLTNSSWIGGTRVVVSLGHSQRPGASFLAPASRSSRLTAIVERMWERILAPSGVTSGAEDVCNWSRQSAG